MALTRKFLTGMGLTAEQVDAIIEEHGATVEALKEQRDDYKEQAEELKDVKKELADLKEKEGEGSEDAEKWQKKYEDLDKEFKEYKDAEAAKATEQQVKDAYTALLKENKVGDKHINSILEVTKLGDMKLDKDGKLEDVDKLTEAIKERWGGFIVETETKGAKIENPPSGSATKYTSREEIMKIKDASERQAAIKNNPDLFS